MEDKELICELEVPNYIRTYIKSNNVRPKFFQQGKKTLPLKFCNQELYKLQDIREPDGVKYYWDKFSVVRQGRKQMINFLVDASTSQRLVSNPDDVGKVKTGVINGQAIYNGNVVQHERNNMIGAIKDYFRPFILTLLPITKFPLRIDCYVYDVVFDMTGKSGGQDWDVENRFFPYGKSFHDLLTEIGTELSGNVPRKKYDKEKDGKIIRNAVIPDDNRFYITEPAHPIFVPIDNPSHAKMVFKIYQDTRVVVKEDTDFIDKLK